MEQNPKSKEMSDLFEKIHLMMHARRLRCLLLLT